MKTKFHTRSSCVAVSLEFTNSINHLLEGIVEARKRLTFLEPYSLLRPIHCTECFKVIIKRNNANSFNYLVLLHSVPKFGQHATSSSPFSFETLTWALHVSYSGDFLSPCYHIFSTFINFTVWLCHHIFTRLVLGILIVYLFASCQV